MQKSRACFVVLMIAIVAVGLSAQEDRSRR